MNSFYLLQNPEVFQGEKKIKYTNSYFEGWYFKHTIQNKSISFIPGIHIEEGKKSAFIQVITNFSSYYISYPFDEFSFSHEPFFIRIGNNFFSLNEIKIDLQDTNIKIQGELFYSNHKKINKSFLMPNIMGPFSYLPFMECNHAILSMKHEVNGLLMVNEQPYHFKNGIGYIEKDWGSSFPTSYVWAQANDFENPDCSFFLSVATIPISCFSFTGFICSLILEGKEYRFSTYNGSKIANFRTSSQNFNIVLKQKDYRLHIYSDTKNSFSLKAPRVGSMNREIFESIDANIMICLSKQDAILFEGKSKNCGLEIVL